MSLRSGLRSGLVSGLESGLDPSWAAAENPVFPNTAATLGVIMGEEPDRIWPVFGAMPIVDTVNADNFVVQAGAPNFGVALTGLWNGVDHTSMVGLEFTTTADLVSLVSGEDLDPGTASFAFLLVYRTPTSAGVNRSIVSTRDTGGLLQGWHSGTLTGTNRIFSQADQGSSHVSNIVTGDVVGTDWHYSLIVCDRTAETFATFTDMASDTDSIAGYTTLTGTSELILGSAPVALAQVGIQYAYAAYWTGAKAENLGATEATAFWQPQLDNP